MSREWLLDVNVLIAMVWPSHQGHERVQQWLARHAREGWATCSVTQMGFVRILSNPAFSPNALTPADALELLRTNLDHPKHRFWGEDISFVEAVHPLVAGVRGHRQITNAYLLSLALCKKGKLATLDQGVLALLPEKSQERESVALI